MSEENKREYVQNEASVPARRRGKKAAVGRHCKRFWWVHLIIFCCITVLVVCLVIFVGVPNIAQSKINDAKLELQGVNILQTKSNSFLMQINSTIKTDGTVKADIDPFVGDLYLEDDPDHTTFATLNFPKTNGDKHQIVNISQEVNVANMDAFRKFNTWFVNNDTLKITINGRTKVKPSGLDRKYGVTFKKTLEVNGLNLFKGTTVPVSTANISIDPSVTRNFNGTSVIPNQSLFTLDIGNVSFTNFVTDQNVGTLYINDLILAPGNNTVQVSASMNNTVVLNAVVSPQYCKSGFVPVKLLGKSVENNGENITYFADALGSANQTVPIDIKAIIAHSQHINLNCS